MPWCASGLEAERLLCPELAEESSLVARIRVLFSNMDSFPMQVLSHTIWSLRWA